MSPQRTINVVIDPPEISIVGSATLGPQGKQGEQGEQGIQGPPGSSTPTYIHTQGVPSDTWAVTHGLNKYPSVDVVDTGDSVVIPSVHYDSLNSVTLMFGSPTSGKAFMN